MPARVAIFQHAESEGPGVVGRWLKSRGFECETVRWWEEGAALRDAGDIAGCVILGGGMNIYQHRDFPWLVREKAAIAGILGRGVPVLGICLGAQLLADALGARVVQNPEYELGWWPVDFSPEAREKFPGLPERQTVFHWHGDTFSLPSGATRIASSRACPEQGFACGENILALQFHPELDAPLLDDFLAGDPGAWPKGAFAQTPEAIRKAAPEHLPKAGVILEPLLAKMFSDAPARSR